METNYSTENIEQKWYNKTWVVVLLCIFFFPVGVYALWKNSSIKKGWKITVTILISLIVIAQFGDNSNSTKNNTQKDRAEKNENPKSTEIINSEALSKTDSLKEELKREITSFIKPFDSSTYRGSVEALQIEIVLFSIWSNIISEGQKNTNNEVNKLASELKNKVVARQIKEFPEMRRNYGKVIAEKLWEENIEISTEGSKSEIINLTAGMFANNKNIAETQRTLIKVLTQFRFKEVRYRWYKSASEFTYYKLESPKDNELKQIIE